MKTLLIISVLVLSGCSSISAQMPGTYLNSCIKDGNTVAECQAIEKQAFASGGKTYVTKATQRALKDEAKRYVLYEDARSYNEAWLMAELCKEGNRRWC